MGHFYAEMNSEVEPREEVLTGFVVTKDFRVMPTVKARADLKFLHYISATRFPDERTAREYVKVAVKEEISKLEARIVDLKRRSRNIGKRNG